jgi:hypothetical protein
MMRADIVMRLFCQSSHGDLNDPLVVTQFIETMELLRVYGPKNNIQAAGDYLRADGPFEGKNDCDQVKSSY